MRQSEKAERPRHIFKAHDSGAANRPVSSTPVFLTLRVHTTDMASVRHCLHECIGTRFVMYIAKVDYSRGVTILQLEADRALVNDVMVAVMRHLPEAEFGSVKTAQVH